eukprot:1984214-Amphidinium_carterae.1
MGVTQTRMDAIEAQMTAVTGQLAQLMTVFQSASFAGLMQMANQQMQTQQHQPDSGQASGTKPNSS